MPNLVGCWSPDQATDLLEHVVSRQLERVGVPRIDYTAHRAAGDGCAMALLDHGLLENGAQPARSGDGTKLLLLDGEVNNAAELRHHFAPLLPPGSLAPPEICLHLIERHGPAVARLFNGFFCIALYDEAALRLTLIADRYGARPCFYVRRPASFLFGTELKALAIADTAARRIDEAGLLELFCYGTHFQDRTWMEGYRRLPPATVLTIDRAGLKLSRYWTYRYDEAARALDQPTYAAVFGILLDRAVERCMGGSRRVGLFLSGGYDSRSVAAAIRKHRRPMPAFTFGTQGSRDVRYAALLADRLGLEHRVLNRDGAYLLPSCRAIVWRTEGMIAFGNATSYQWHAEFAREMDIILTGFLGEFSGSHTWPELLLARSRRAAMTAIRNRFLVPRLPVAKRVFKPAFVARAREAVEDNFRRSFEQIEDDHPLNIADSWNFVNLQPRGTFQAPAVDRHRFEMRAPHTDNDLVDFLLRIPPYARIEQRVYKAMIAHCFPDIRDVPCTNSGRPVDPRFLREYAAMTGELAARKAGAVARRLFGRPTTLGREFRDLGADFRAEPALTESLLPSLLDGILPETIFDRGGIMQLVEAHRCGSGSYEHAIGLLMSVGLAIKYLFYDDLADLPPELWPP